MLMLRISINLFNGTLHRALVLVRVPEGGTLGDHERTI